MVAERYIPANLGLRTTKIECGPRIPGLRTTRIPRLCTAQIWCGHRIPEPALCDPSLDTGFPDTVLRKSSTETGASFRVLCKGCPARDIALLNFRLPNQAIRNHFQKLYRPCHMRITLRSKSLDALALASRCRDL